MHYRYLSPLEKTPYIGVFAALAAGLATYRVFGGGLPLSSPLPQTPNSHWDHTTHSCLVDQPALEAIVIAS